MNARVLLDTRVDKILSSSWVEWNIDGEKCRDAMQCLHEFGYV